MNCFGFQLEILQFFLLFDTGRLMGCAGYKIFVIENEIFVGLMTEYTWVIVQIKCELISVDRL